MLCSVGKDSGVMLRLARTAFYPRCPLLLLHVDPKGMFRAMYAFPRRRQHIADISAQRKELDATLAQIDAALDRTRPDRVAALADDPPEHLVARIGPAPMSPAGRAVWCHHALGIEAALDRNDGLPPASTGRSPQTDRARYEIAIADRVLEVSSDRPAPSQWAELAQQASVVLDRVRRAERNRSARQRTPAQWQQPQPWMDPAAERPHPGISM